MRTAEEFVKSWFPHEFREFQRKGLGEAVKELSIFEKTLVYKYTKDYFENTNEALRDGRETEFASLLDQALKKLPDYKDLTFRGASLSRFKKEAFLRLEESGEPFEESAFFSSSKSELTANEFSRGDTIFHIYGKHGKNVEALAFHGSLSPVNEKEVIFCPKTKFLVLSVTIQPGKTSIILEEIDNEPLG